ncbi:MAG: hypothetical protein AAF441_01085 [Pseudomonadota bacterium]
MRFTATEKGEDRVAEMQRKARQALKDKEKERQEQRDKSAKLKALRLEKEAADRQTAVEQEAASTGTSPADSTSGK